ncbi:uncharacterized protein AB675_7567 [Cyphellophora attinorum]|uniref:Uncharacterized protein n=1 Tax=Cyphellophora attinorum TaxID=1664694 RepID=A0A0N1HQX8_9EURO|nr:uncharacterized protein AB675_7567 [Phialophora attinorum]KPI40500.1 hypothetical protein AB675_7567 [Phialophora attinorum]
MLAWMLAATAFAEDVLEQRDSTWIGVYTCPQPNWSPQDQCRWTQMEITGNSQQGKCYAIDPSTSDKLSFGPDQGIWCILFTGKECSGDQSKIYYPGTPYLGQWRATHMDGGANPTSKFQSFSCGRS